MMRRKQPDRFEKALERGKYLFHIHTDWTDGISSLSEYCEAAKKLGFKAIILLEHIRKRCSYNFDAFFKLAQQQESKHDVEIVVGVEAKVLPDGTVDMPDSIYSQIEVLGIAEHSFKGDAGMLAKALYQAARWCRELGFPCVWVHPGLGLLHTYNDRLAFQKIMDVALCNGLYIELNLRYNLPPEWALNKIPSRSIVVGLDAHSVEEVRRLARRVLDKEIMF